MNIFTNGVELVTGLSNLLILIISIIGFFLFIKNNKYIYIRYWKLFFIFMMLSSFLGFIVHSFLLSELIVKILWYIIIVLFSIVINILLSIVLLEINEKSSYKQSLKETGIMSVILCLCMFILFSANVDFIFIFALYCSFILLLSLYIYIKGIIKNNKYCFYYIFGIIIQIVGGLFLINHNIDFRFFIDINYNVIYHFFMSVTLILFILGTKTKLDSHKKLYK